jgi:hypothetical protein
MEQEHHFILNKKNFSMASFSLSIICHMKHVCKGSSKIHLALKLRPSRSIVL